MSEPDRDRRYRRALQPKPPPSVGLSSFVVPVMRDLVETQAKLDAHAERSLERLSEDGIAPSGFAVTSLRYTAGIAIGIDEAGIAVAPRWDSEASIAVAVRFMPRSFPELFAEED
ncbi:MAG TPA: hypothetical protein VF516_46890 [Kofleriaceae bacterium]